MSRLFAPTHEYLICVMMTVMTMAAAIFFMVMVMMTMMLMAAAILFMVMMMSVVLMAAATFFMVMVMTVMLMAAAIFFMVMVMVMMMMQKFLYLGSMLQCTAYSFLPQSLPWRGNNRGISILIPEHADTFLYLLIRHHLCSADHNRGSVLYLIREELSEVLKI